MICRACRIERAIAHGAPLCSACRELCGAELCDRLYQADLALVRPGERSLDAVRHEYAQAIRDVREVVSGGA